MTKEFDIEDYIMINSGGHLVITTAGDLDNPVQKNGELHITCFAIDLREEEVNLKITGNKLAATIVPVPDGFGFSYPTYYITSSKNVNISGNNSSAVLSMLIDGSGSLEWENSFKNVPDPDNYDVGASAFFCPDMGIIFNLSNSVRYRDPIITKINPATGALIDNMVIDSDMPNNEAVAGFQIINDPGHAEIILMARVEAMDFTRMGTFYPNNNPVRVIRVDKASLTHIEERTLIIPSSDHWGNYDGFLENQLFSHFPIIFTPNIGAYYGNFEELRIVTESQDVTASGLNYDLAYLYLDYHLDGVCFDMNNTVIEYDITQSTHPGISVSSFVLTDNLNISRSPNPPDLYDCMGIPQFANKKNGEENIDPQGELSITISPNPSSGIFQFSVNSQEVVNFNFTIHDLNGRVVHKSLGNAKGNHSELIDLSKMSKGMYIITVSTHDQMIREKLLIH